MSEQSLVRVLIVDDSVPWCRFVVNELQAKPHWLVVGVVSQGIEAVRKTKELQPDLILLDINLPGLNGIEAARLMHKLSPSCKILFLTGEFDSDMAGAALGAGGRGYVIKLDAGRELLTAVEAVLLGRRYFSRSLAGYGLTERENE